MKKKMLLQRAAAALLSLFLCACCLPRANALAPIEDRTCSLSVDFHGYAGVIFRIYRAGDVSDTGRFTLTGDFADCPVGSLTNLTGSGWRDMAKTLSDYAADKHLTPTQTAETDSAGKLTVTGLERGLYLVVGERTGFASTTGTGTTYISPVPFLVSLPTWQEGDTWLYDVGVTPKYEGSQTASVMRRVLKVWNDNNNAANRRPAQITVDLLRNGEIYDTVTLSAENNWRYVWEDLDNSYEWRVVERNVASDYRVMNSFQGVTFVLTNTYNPPDNPPPDNPPPPPPDNPPPDNPPPDNPPPENPPPEDVEIPDEPPPQTDLEIPDNPPPLSDLEIPDPEVPLAPAEPDEEVEVEDPDVPLARLPQTGQLWWPVPLLAMGGMALFILGWARRRNSGYES